MWRGSVGTVCDACDTTPARVTYLGYEDGATSWTVPTTVGDALYFTRSSWPAVTAAELHEHRRVTLCETFGALTLETITPVRPA